LSIAVLEVELPNQIFNLGQRPPNFSPTLPQAPRHQRAPYQQRAFPQDNPIIPLGHSPDPITTIFDFNIEASNLQGEIQTSQSVKDNNMY